MVIFIILLSTAANKRGKWQAICQSFIVERWLTKEALKTWQLFFSVSVLGTASFWRKEAPRQETPARGLTPILTPYRWHSADTGSMETYSILRPAHRDQLDEHKDISMPAKCVFLLKSKIPLKNIHSETSFTVRTKSIWLRGFREALCQIKLYNYAATLYYAVKAATLQVSSGMQ